MTQQEMTLHPRVAALAGELQVIDGGLALPQNRFDFWRDEFGRLAAEQRTDLVVHLIVAAQRLVQQNPAGTRVAVAQIASLAALLFDEKAELQPALDQAGISAEAAQRILGSAPQAFESKSGNEPPRGVFDLLRSTKKS